MRVINCKAHTWTGIQFLVWWAANSLYAVDVQKVLRRFDGAPLMFIDLALLQIAVGIAMAFCINLYHASRNGTVQEKLTKPNLSAQKANLAIGCLHISAVMLTNYSYRAIGSTSTLVWKLSEPFAAVVLKRLILKQRTELLSLAGVTLVVIGVLTYSVKSMSMFAASPIVLSNILFPTRNVVVKLSQKDDGPRVSTAQRYSAFLYFSLPFAVGLWALKVPFEPTRFEALPFLLRNALLFNVYQFVSISLLEKLDALTHSLANTLKRFLGILLSAFLLKEHLTERHIVGLVLTATGFCLYIQNGRHKSNTPTRSTLKLGLFGVLMLVPIGIMGMTAYWNLLGGELASGAMKKYLNNSFALESDVKLVFKSEQDHRAYLDSLKGVRRDLYIIPRPPQNMSDYSVDENNVWSFTGSNLGNLVWGRAAFQMLADFSSATKCESFKLTVCTRNIFEQERLSSGLLYAPVSNVFHEESLRTLGSFKNRVETGFELLVIGAGLQHSFDHKSKEIKNPGMRRKYVVEQFQHNNKTLEFLAEMERRSQTIMVRGDITLQTLQRAGFTHGISAGCPSLFLSKELRLGQLLERKYEALRNRIGDTSLKIGMNIAMTEKLHDMWLSIYERYPQSLIFAQGPTDLTFLEKVHVSKSRVRIFSDVDKWQAELRQMDVVVGGRIHGSMLGLGSSIPVFVIAPDYRVLELVERMMVPHTTIFDERLKQDFDVAELVYNERINATRFDNNRCGIAKLYRSVFERYGFGVSEHVWQISQIC